MPLSDELSVSSTPGLFPGYTTADDAGADGDDTVHSAIPSYPVPNCIHAIVAPSNDSSSSWDGTAGPDSIVDLVYIDFIERYVALAAQVAGLELDLPGQSDVYMSGKTLSGLIQDWVSAHWHC